MLDAAVAALPAIKQEFFDGILEKLQQQRLPAGGVKRLAESSAPRGKGGVEGKKQLMAFL